MDTQKLTLEYTRKLAQQVIFNEHTRGNLLAGEVEDLAKHIMASGRNRWTWHDTVQRKKVRIDLLFTWSTTKQGRGFWEKMHRGEPIPPFVGEVPAGAVSEKSGR